MWMSFYFSTVNESFSLVSNRSFRLEPQYVTNNLTLHQVVQPTKIDSSTGWLVAKFENIGLIELLTSRARYCSKLYIISGLASEYIQNLDIKGDRWLVEHHLVCLSINPVLAKRSFNACYDGLFYLLVSSVHSGWITLVDRLIRGCVWVWERER